MKTLIVEDDFTSRLLLLEILQGYGTSHVAANGLEAVGAVSAALDAEEPYDLVCMDIMMPEMDGQQALREIRALEERKGRDCGRGARILMTTALGDKQNVLLAFREQCDGYLVKPLNKRQLLDQLAALGLVGELS